MLLQNNGFDCLEEEWKLGHNAGIAEGLRLAAKMFRESKFTAFKNNVPMGVHGFDFYQKLMAKAKEVEEGKGEK